MTGCALKELSTAKPQSRVLFLQFMGAHDSAFGAGPVASPSNRSVTTTLLCSGYRQQRPGPHRRGPGGAHENAAAGRDEGAGTGQRPTSDVRRPTSDVRRPTSGEAHMARKFFAKTPESKMYFSCKRDLVRTLGSTA